MWRIGLTFIVLFIPNILCMSEEMIELMEMLHNTCKDQTSLDDAIYAEAKKGGFPDDPKLKCYMKCIMFEMSTMDEDGIVDVDTAVALLPEDLKAKVEPVMRKCGTQQGVDPCDNAFLTFKCYYNEAPSDYMLI